MAAHLDLTDTVVVRRAVAADAEDLSALAALDSAHPLTGPVLVAEIDGRLLAALDLASGRTVADPFRRTASLLTLLRLRARALSTRTPARRRFAALHRATAA